MAGALFVSAVWMPTVAQAQSSCSSDGVKPPTSITERFFSADCSDCWAAQSAATAPQTAVLDWIVPSAAGDDAPLSAAATRDAIYRLQALQLAEPKADTTVRSTAVNRLPPYSLRVAMGQSVNGYIGTSIELKNLPAIAKRPQQAWTSVMVLLEALPANAEGNASPRFIVRNSQVSTWNMREQLPKPERQVGAVTTKAFFDSRPMGIPEGTKAERLQVLAWLQDAQGRVVASAQSRCRG